ncbi:MAG: ABC transporter ATP-binding protein [Patescibacteria group bacterium]|jgi:putative ABC transport system ATP-binding protein
MAQEMTAVKEKTIAELAAESASASQNTQKAVIEVNDVSKSFVVGKNVISVLKNINLKIYPEEFIIILGPSGSGKSTLLNILLGLEAPTTGHVVLNGTDITYMKTDKIAKIRYGVYGIIFQRSDWIRSFSVLDNVTLPLALNNIKKKIRREQAWMRLKQVGMADHGLYYPTELSGGQQQKVSLARSLINDPPIIVADEPTGNLDSVSAERVMNTFKDLNEKEHKTVMMVTHNIDYVRYASRTIYVRDGTIIEGSEQFKK